MERHQMSPQKCYTRITLGTQMTLPMKMSHIYHQDGYKLCEETYELILNEIFSNKYRESHKNIILYLIMFFLGCPNYLKSYDR